MGTLDWLSNFIPGIGEVTDHDRDGCKDRSDEDFDRDNDGLNDYPALESLDACPMGEPGIISTKETDYDGDGCLDSNLNGEDRDDDNDAVDSVADLCPKVLLDGHQQKLQTMIEMVVETLMKILTRITMEFKIQMISVLLERFLPQIQ